jgi:hypothetical protein
MSHAASHAAFERVVIHTRPHVAAPATSACCQQAVVEALETAGSFGFIATLTMLFIGFGMGLTTAWMLFW